MQGTGNSIAIENNSSHKESGIEWVTLYPNPNPGTFAIEVNATDFQPYTIEVFSPVGELLSRTEHVNTLKTNCNHSNLPNGLYLVKISMGGRVVVKKLIKQ